MSGFGYEPAKHAELRQQVKANESIETQLHHLDLAAKDVNNHELALKELEARLKKAGKGKLAKADRRGTR